MPRIKICGITNLDDAMAAADAGADALGFVFFKESPRHIFPEEAAAIISKLPPFVSSVGLFVDETTETVLEISGICGLDLLQLHGDEPPEACIIPGKRVIKAFRVKNFASTDRIHEYRVSACLLDAYSPAAHGGTGRTFNWEIAAHAALTNRIVLAGGLTPDNVASAVRAVRPYGIDVSSGVESAPGKKDHALLRLFINNARSASSP